MENDIVNKWIAKEREDIEEELRDVRRLITQKLERLRLMIEQDEEKALIIEYIDSLIK